MDLDKQSSTVSLTSRILVAVALGIIAGVWMPGGTPLFDLLGRTFLRLLKMVMVPLIVTSIMSGMVQVGNLQNLGRLGLQVGGYYVATSLLAILTGLALVNLFQPGVDADVPMKQRVETIPAAEASLPDLVDRLIPDNLFRALAEGDLLALIVVSLLVGLCISRVPDPFRQPLETLVEGASHVMMRLTHLIMWLAPFGIFGLVATIIATTGLELFGSLATYLFTVAVGLLIHSLATLPLIILFLGKARPLEHGRAMIPSVTTAFATASSAATLPLTMKCAEENAHVPNHISRFVLPLGATINMDGTALYECVAVLFIAQAYGIELTILQQGSVVITALLVSIGAAGIPMAGLVMMSIITQAVGLPVEGIGLVLAVDRILDMLRTAVNVWSDSCGAKVVAAWQSHEGKNEKLAMRND